jgi:hypothetical protein
LASLKGIGHKRSQSIRDAVSRALDQRERFEVKDCVPLGRGERQRDEQNHLAG